MKFTLTIEPKKREKKAPAIVSFEDSTLTLTKIKEIHRDTVLPMVELFYSSDAVDHAVKTEILSQTFTDVADPENSSILGYLLESEGKTVGFFYLTSFYCCEVGGICVMIEEIFIHQEFQGKGFGTIAMEYIKLSNPKAKRFRLEVTESNEGAVALYKKLGYEFLAYGQMILDV